MPHVRAGTTIASFNADGRSCDDGVKVLLYGQPQKESVPNNNQVRNLPIESVKKIFYLLLYILFIILFYFILFCFIFFWFGCCARLLKV
jgi:hypothetical protein